VALRTAEEQPGQTAPSRIAAKPLVEPITDLNERVFRRIGLMGTAFSSAHRFPGVNLLHPHMKFPERLQDRQVLEIGGVENDLRQYFRSLGASYLNVRLEKGQMPSTQVGDFMGIHGMFDVIVSLGVFEEGGIDRHRMTGMRLGTKRTDRERLAKLSSLLKSGGACIIGTISHPCLFRDVDIRAEGLETVHRQGPFYSFLFLDLDKRPYDPADKSELLLLSRA
jgi:hypothetical protein